MKFEDNSWWFNLIVLLLLIAGLVILIIIEGRDMEEINCKYYNMDYTCYGIEDYLTHLSVVPSWRIGLIAAIIFGFFLAVIYSSVGEVNFWVQYVIAGLLIYLGAITAIGFQRWHITRPNCGKDTCNKMRDCACY